MATLHLNLVRMAWNRLQADFLSGSRLDEYRELLQSATVAGYQIAPVRALAHTNTPSPARLCVLRHDVDTDPETACMMWRIELDLGITSSYFFRLSTVDPRLMREIAAHGGEVGYHYEEFATLAKSYGLHTAEQVMRHLPEARALFRANLEGLRSSTGLPLRSAASHGDFINRRLGITNKPILSDPVFRETVGIDLEAYDESLRDQLAGSFRDLQYPARWLPLSPALAIESGDTPIHILVHPRQWRANPKVNGKDDTRRLWEGVAYRARCWRQSWSQEWGKP